MGVKKAVLYFLGLITFSIFCFVVSAVIIIHYEGQEAFIVSLGYILQGAGAVALAATIFYKIKSPDV